jgi:hypothetical protein
MEVKFEAQDIIISRKLNIGDIRSITVCYIPQLDIYNCDIFADKKRTIKVKNIKFNNIEFTKKKQWNCDKPYLYIQKHNGKYINFYPEGLKDTPDHILNK